MNISEIYEQVADVLLEPLPTGLSLGIVTEDEFLNYCSDVVQDILQKGGLVKKMVALEVTAGTSEYTEPNYVFDAQDAMYNERYIGPDWALDMDSNIYNWRGKLGPPRIWHEDRMAINSIQVEPTPNAEGMLVNMASPLYGTLSAVADTNDFYFVLPTPLYGTVSGFSGPVYVETASGFLGTFAGISSTSGNLTVLYVSGGFTRSFAIDDLVQILPDSFLPYIKYGVLAKIFSMDGESKDIARAKYCTARYEECIALCKAVMEDTTEAA